MTAKSKERVKFGRVDKRKTRENSKNIQESAKNVANNNGSDDMSDVLNVYCDGEVTTLKWVFSNLPYKPIKRMPGVSVVLIKGVSQGFLKIMPGKIKSKQMVIRRMCFTVFEGKAEVGVQEAVRILNKTDVFLVPPGKHTLSRFLDRLK